MENIVVSINETLSLNGNYIQYNDRKIEFDNIEGLTIKYGKKIITFQDTNNFNLIQEYNNIINILKKQNICLNNIKTCKGCANPLLYICSAYCTKKEEHKIELAKYTLLNGININDRCCKFNNALIYTIKYKYYELSKYLLEQKIYSNVINSYNLSPITILFDGIIYKKFILHDNAYNYVELLLKHKADPNMAFLNKKSTDNFIDILLLWNTTHTNIIQIKTIYNEIKDKLQINIMREKIFKIFELLVKYGFNFKQNYDFIKTICYTSSKIIKYKKLDTVACKTFKLMANKVDINDCIDNYQFLSLFNVSILHTNRQNFDKQNYQKFKLFFECGLSTTKILEIICVSQFFSDIDKILHTIIVGCTHVPNTTQFLKLLLDYFDNDTHITHIRDQLPTINEFHIFINRKLAIMKFIETQTGYKINRGIFDNLDILRTLLLVRKTINDNNLRIIILYKIIPLIYI